MKTIRVGIIGAGAIALDHAQGINSHPQAEVVAIADISKKRANEMKKELGLAKAYYSGDDLLADPDIDAVAIALPNKFHAPASLAALKAKKHVLLDKPFALNQKEAKQVLETARKVRRVFMLGMNWRMNPDTQTIKAIVERGELGEIYHAKAIWRRRSGIPKFGTWFCDKKMAGGGALLDIGVHLLDCCLHLMDNFKPVSVSGKVYTKFGNRKMGEGGWGKSDKGKHVFDVDDYANALIKFKNGATVALDISWACHQEHPNTNNVELYGTDAGAGVMPAKIYRNGKKAGEYEVVEPQGVKIRYPHANRHYNWIDTILKADKPIITPQESLVIQKILDGIYESSKTGREVKIK